MLFNVVLTIHVLVCLSLIGIILIQRGRGAGLIESAAGAESLFGTKTASFFVQATTVLAILFFVLSIALTILSKHRGTSVLEKMSVPSAPKAQAVSAEEKAPAAKEEAAPVAPTAQAVPAGEPAPAVAPVATAAAQEATTAPAPAK